jgi:RNA polymerase sigma-70 factor (ECF subfamily)
MVAMGRVLMAGIESAQPTEGAAQVDRQTLLACKAQDPLAFRRFVLGYERAVFALISRVLGCGPHVQDLAQETFLRAYRAFPGFDVDGVARPSTWLLTIAVRLALNARKELSRSAPLSIVAAAAWSHDSTPETEGARRELGRAIAAAAAELSEDQRAAFVLAQFHGLSIAEIAQALEIPENTVKTRLFRARAHMRARLAPFEKGPLQ